MIDLFFEKKITNNSSLNMNHAFHFVAPNGFLHYFTRFHALSKFPLQIIKINLSPVKASRSKSVATNQSTEALGFHENSDNKTDHDKRKNFLSILFIFVCNA